MAHLSKCLKKHHLPILFLYIAVAALRNTVSQRESATMGTRQQIHKRKMRVQGIKKKKITLRQKGKTVKYQDDSRMNN